MPLVFFFGETQLFFFFLNFLFSFSLPTARSEGLPLSVPLHGENPRAQTDRVKFGSAPQKRKPGVVCGQDGEGRMVKAGGGGGRRAWVRQPNFLTSTNLTAPSIRPAAADSRFAAVREEPCAIIKGEEYYAVLVDIQIFKFRVPCSAAQSASVRRRDR